MHTEIINYVPWFVAGGSLTFLTIFWMATYPRYSVWASRLSGQAKLQEANNEQRIQVSQAQARLEAADLNKKAAIIEAEAVAKQIETIGANLQKHDLYLKWQWIKMMEDKPNGSVIYVPTEANLPILEAMRSSYGSISEVHK